MRYLHALFLVLIAFASLAQPNLPVRVTQPIAVSFTNDLASILAREGEEIELAVNTSAVWNKQEINGGHYMGGASIPPGKAIYVSNVKVGSDARAVLQYSMGQLQNFGNPPQVASPVITPLGGGTISIPYKDFWLMPGSNAGGLSVLKVFGADTLTSHRWTFSISGTQITADLNFNAPYKMLYVGTSIAAGTGVTDTQNMFSFRLRRYMRDTLGYDVRLINKAVSGSNSGQTEVYRQRGRYDIGTVNVIVYEHGANDAGGSVSTASYIANVAAFVRWKQMFQPKAVLFIQAPSPNGNTTTESFQTGYRTALASYVSGLNDPRVRYVAGTGTAWNPVTQSGTFTTDQIHPNDAGNLRLYWALRDDVLAAKNAGLLTQFAFPLLLLPMFRRRKNDLLGIRTKRPALKPRIRQH